ncbi:MAG: beta-ketoacyl-[acyl-carrier-protein] synthase I [Hirschia sp.]|nr:beta-ketoacyl-[acyl-carrier-protein] synthase I [Hirschia sp.]MBF18638.1 beta-ketoacyl-[acyl-carrier-protein] synthase I [Hirschia sp.]
MSTPELRRVVVTGMGIVSSIGDSVKEVTESLKNGASGITFSEEYAERGFRSQVHGKPRLNPADHIEKRAMRFMGDGAGYCHMAMGQAIADSGLEQDTITNERTGLIVGTGGPSTRAIVAAADVAREKGIKRIGPFAVPKAMCSTASAALSTMYKILGVNYSISSACTTSLHCIGAAAEQIQWGKQDVMFAGGGDEVDWTFSSLFDAMGAMSSKYNDTPEKASRAFDANRDGFVISGGAGIVVLEEYERAKKRGAPIYGEIVGYAATSDGHDMVAPNGDGAIRAMKQVLAMTKRLPDYLNPHATSTPAGDMVELNAVREVFGQQAADQPMISATKSMTGHAMGAAGVHEMIYSMLMMKEKFIAPSINIENLDPLAYGVNIIKEARDAVLDVVMSNSFGFGGTNGSVAVAKV